MLYSQLSHFLSQDTEYKHGVLFGPLFGHSVGNGAACPPAAICTCHCLNLLTLSHRRTCSAPTSSQQAIHSAVHLLDHLPSTPILSPQRRSSSRNGCSSSSTSHSSSSRSASLHVHSRILVAAELQLSISEHPGRSEVTSRALNALLQLFDATEELSWSASRSGFPVEGLADKQARKLRNEQ